MSFFSKPKRGALAILLISLFALGCGGSQEDFVFTNTNANTGVGNVVFQFVKAQAGTVPADTASFAFDFYAAENGQVIYTSTAPFANTVTVVDVPVEARFVVITCYDNDGHPRATLSAAIVVLPNVNNLADLSNAQLVTVTFDSISVGPDPVNLNLGTADPSAQLVITANFSNGESIAVSAADNNVDGDFFSNATGVATVDGFGEVNAVAVGDTTIDVDYTIDGVTQSDSVDVHITSGVADDVLTVTPSTLLVAAGETSDSLSASLSINGAGAVDVTGDPDLTYTSNNADFVVDENTGEVTVLNTVTPGETATVTATFDDGTNFATDTVAVTEGSLTGTIQEFPVITADAGPEGVCLGPDGNVWFTEQTANKIGRITPAGVVTEFSTGLSAASNLVTITAGPDGNLWFVESAANKIGRITTAGVITEFSTGLTAAAGLNGIAAGPDGNLWFTEASAIKIGRITPAGVITEFSTGLTAGPNGIVAGPDGNLWFAEPNGDRIGRITTSGTITEFTAGITAGSRPIDITEGPDGNLWFAEIAASNIGRITTAGVVTEFPINAAARAITTGPDDNLWFTQQAANKIGRLTTAGVVTDFSAGLTPAATLVYICTGGDGNLWFAEKDGNNIGVIVP